MNILTYLRARAYTAARELGASEEGATATEYVFLLVFIAIVIAVGAAFLGNAISDRFTAAGNQVSST